MKISVCLATYNGDKFIRAQIQSILPQLGENDEIIISDNGSTDDTVKIINDINDYRIKIYSFHKRKNYSFSDSSHYTISSNFENALKKAQGDFIFLADQDDVWLPLKVQSSLAALKNSDLVISNCSTVDEHGVLLDEKLLKLTKFSTNILSNIVFPRFHGCCMAFRASLLEFILPFPNMLVLHDSWIGIIASKVGCVSYLDDDLILYRLHSSNSSGIDGKSKNNFYFKIFYRVQLLLQVLERLYKIKTKKK